MYHLFLDDERIPEDVTWLVLPDKKWVVVRSYEMFVSHIQHHGLPAFVSFDHDLGEENATPSPTGMDCAKWLVEYCLNENVLLPDYAVHSKNPPGKHNIESLLQSFQQHQKPSKPSF